MKEPIDIRPQKLDKQQQSLSGFQKLELCLSEVPAVTHVDNSCRPQSINQEQNAIIHKALLNFKEMSGVPVFLNTSFKAPFLVNFDGFIDTGSYF
mgnify:CR=1 FL=1